MGVRPAGPSMKTALAVPPPEVVMSPEVTVMLCVLFCASRPRSPASGDMSRSAKVMAPVLLARSTASPAELVTLVLPKLAATLVLDIRRPMPAASSPRWRPEVPEFTATQVRPSTNWSPNSCSNAATSGPCATIPEARTASTALRSSAPMIGLAGGMNSGWVTLLSP